jgi:hypothetical protein
MKIYESDMISLARRSLCQVVALVGLSYALLVVNMTVLTFDAQRIPLNSLA